jgi:hypothetical protein
MNCHEARGSLSLYLYGELDFAQEEELESHLGECAFCQLSLAREKSWHGDLSAQCRDVPLQLLSECRRDLHKELAGERKTWSPVEAWRRWQPTAGFSLNRWSLQLALASLLVFAGFAGGRWGINLLGGRLGRGELSLGAVQTAGINGMVDPSAVRIRDIQPGERGRVRIFVDYEGEIAGSANDENVRKYLLAGTKESDPSIRVYSLESLDGQNGNDVRDALLFTVRHDSNAAVRLRALDGLRRFASDRATLDGLRFVLEHDNSAAVRSEAVDILTPADGRAALTPQMTEMLRDVMRSAPDDDYVHARCGQLLRAANIPSNLY